METRVSSFSSFNNNNITLGGKKKSLSLHLPMIKGYKDWVEMRDFLSVFVPCILNHKEQHQQIADLILSFGIVKQHNITLSFIPLSISLLSFFFLYQTDDE